MPSSRLTKIDLNQAGEARLARALKISPRPSLRTITLGRGCSLWQSASLAGWPCADDGARITLDGGSALTFKWQPPGEPMVLVPMEALLPEE
ncbi:MAG: hypothetical protein ACYC11_00775 [Bellilinea sp.]